jgi:chemotaxis-related protein WspD
LECALDPRPPTLDSALVHDCWSTIGVSGNGTCRELQKFIHCRNCPVYSAAGIQLLDRPLSVDYRRERTGHYAEVKKITRPAKTSLVIFRLGSEWLALPTLAFQEVAEQRSLHTLPHRRHSVVLGLVNIRGELLICASLARLLGLTEMKKEEGRMQNVESRPASSFFIPHSSFIFDRLLVANWDGHRLAFPVDEVHGIHRFHRDEMKEPPATISKSTLTHTRGIFAWRERSVGFLDADSLFSALNRSLM